MTDRLSAFLMFTSGLIATLFIAYAVLLQGRPPTFRSDWRRAAILPKGLRQRVRAWSLVAVVSTYGMALIGAVDLVRNCWLLGEYSLGRTGGVDDVDGLVWNQTLGIAALVLYVLVHRPLFSSNYDHEVRGLRRKRLKRQQEALRLQVDAPADVAAAARSPKRSTTATGEPG